MMHASPDAKDMPIPESTRQSRISWRRDIRPVYRARAAHFSGLFPAQTRIANHLPTVDTQLMLGVVTMLRSALSHPLTRGIDPDDPRTTTLRRRIIAEKPF